MITWDERDIEDYICDHYKEMFGEEYYFIGRQVNIGLGIIDVLLYDYNNEEIAVVEIKKDVIRDNALAQIMRYISGVGDYLVTNKTHKIKDIKGILVGTDINDETASALRFVQRKIEYLELDIKLMIDAEFKKFSRSYDSPNFKPDPFNELVNKATNKVHEEFDEREEGENDG